jgi:hypothetical protein
MPLLGELLATGLAESRLICVLAVLRVASVLAATIIVSPARSAGLRSP